MKNKINESRRDFLKRALFGAVIVTTVAQTGLIAAESAVPEAEPAMTVQEFNDWLFETTGQFKRKYDRMSEARQKKFINFIEDQRALVDNSDPDDGLVQRFYTDLSNEK